MIINTDRAPQFSLYCIGALVIKKLNEKKEISADELYDSLNNDYENKLSIEYFHYALDWLFLLGKIKLEEDKIRLL